MPDVLSLEKCRVMDWGLVDYNEAYQKQVQAVDCVRKGGPHQLFLCEHPPVYTLGRLATEKNFLLSLEAIEKQGIKIIRMNRGGEVTFHGPGQLVVYPIFNLMHLGQDLKLFMGKLEQVAIDLLKSFDIVANRVQGLRGVWTYQGKIASIGIGVRQWVSFHGMAININTDLKFFSMIKPCGLDVQMVSMRSIKGEEINLGLVKQRLIESFSRNFPFEFI